MSKNCSVFEFHETWTEAEKLASMNFLFGKLRKPGEINQDILHHALIDVSSFDYGVMNYTTEKLEKKYFEIRDAAYRFAAA